MDHPQLVLFLSLTPWRTGAVPVLCTLVPCTPIQVSVTGGEGGSCWRGQTGGVVTAKELALSKKNSEFPGKQSINDYSASFLKILPLLVSFSPLKAF